MLVSGTHRNSAQEQIVCGREAAPALDELLQRYGARRVLLVTTRSLAGSDGLATQLGHALGPRCVGVFSQLPAHSPRTAVIAGAQAARRLDSDLLLAVGGGSVVDATKVMQLCLWCELELREQLDAYRCPPCWTGTTAWTRRVSSW